MEVTLIMVDISDIKSGNQLGYKSKQKYIYVACETCGKPRWIELKRYNRGIYKNCRLCASKFLRPRGKNHWCWKGGRNYDNGYVRIMLPLNDFFYPMAYHKGYVLEHRLIMAQHLKRCLHSWEFVHHKNGIRDDNRIENLELATNSSHLTEHQRGYRNGYRKGYLTGKSKWISELEQKVKLLEEKISA